MSKKYNYTKQQREDLENRYNLLGCASIEELDWRKDSKIYTREANEVHFNDIEFLYSYIDYINILAVVRNFNLLSDESLRFLMDSSLYKSKKKQMEIVKAVIENQEVISTEFLDDYYNVIAKFVPPYVVFENVGFNQEYVLKHGKEIHVSTKNILAYLDEWYRHIKTPFTDNYVASIHSKEGVYFKCGGLEIYEDVIAFFELFNSNNGEYKIYYVRID